MHRSIIGRESDETCLIVSLHGQEFQFQYLYDYKISIWPPKSNMAANMSDNLLISVCYCIYSRLLGSRNSISKIIWPWKFNMAHKIQYGSQNSIHLHVQRPTRTCMEDIKQNNYLANSAAEQSSRHKCLEEEIFWGLRDMCKNWEVVSIYGWDEHSRCHVHVHQQNEIYLVKKITTNNNKTI